MRPASRHPILATLFGLALALGCGDMGCGCDMEPLERDLDEADKVYDGVLIEVSPEGFAYVSENFDPILETFVDGGLQFDLPAQPDDCDCDDFVPCYGNEDCPILARLKDIDVQRLATNRLRIAALLDARSSASFDDPPETIDLRVCQSVLACLRATCGLQVHVEDKPLAVEVRLNRDPVTHALTFDVSPPEVEIVNEDFTVLQPSSCSSACSGLDWSGCCACQLLDVDLVKDFIVDFINGELESIVEEEVDAQIDEFTCMPCDYFSAGCADGMDVPGLYCDTETDYCFDSASGECVRAPMGFAGIVDFGALLGGFGADGGRLALHVGVGQRDPPQSDPFIAQDGGPLELRAITGAKALPDSPCVPEASTVPSTLPPPRIDFAAEAGALGYHVGLGISDRFLNKALYEAYKSGVLCLNLGSDAIDLVSTGLFSTFLPSLGVLTEGRNAPMIIAVRPKDRPEIHIGAGTYREENGQTVMDEPLLTVHLKDFHLDFYAFIEERYFRLFTLDLDIALPLGLEVTADNEIIPILGDLDDMVTRIETKNSKILAEDPAVLEDLISAMIGLIEPMIGDALSPIALPDLQGFLLDVTRIGGMVDHPEPGRYEHLGLLAQLALAPPGNPFTAAPTVRLVDVHVPPADRMQPVPGERLPRPSVLVRVGDSTSGPIEWQYRIGGGLWSPFQRSPELRIASSKLLLQGRHFLEVRTRRIGEPQTLDREPVRFAFVVDWEAPSARLSVDPATGIAEVFARDAVTPADRLAYAFAIDGGAFGPFGPERRIELPIDATRLEVRVRDEAGNETELSWDGGLRGMHGRPPQPPGSGDGGCGCASGASGGAALGLLFLVGFAGLPRRRRR
jgi:MYXO-CTERM domain-containing protein